ncbi:hypothetical protein SH2C18_31360 [Clostridium sediminicola]
MKISEETVIKTGFQYLLPFNLESILFDNLYLLSNSGYKNILKRKPKIKGIIGNVFVTKKLSIRHPAFDDFTYQFNDYC